MLTGACLLPVMSMTCCQCRGIMLGLRSRHETRQLSVLRVFEWLTQLQEQWQHTLEVLHSQRGLCLQEPRRAASLLNLLLQLVIGRPLPELLRHLLAPRSEGIDPRILFLR